MPDILQISTEYRSRLFHLDDTTAADIVDRYKRAYLDIEKQAQELLAKIQAQKDKGIEVTRGQLVRLERFGKLESDLESQFKRFGADVTESVTKGQMKSVVLGVNGSTAMGKAGIENSLIVNGSWHRVPVESLEHLVGFFNDGSPLKDLFDTFGKQASDAGRSVIEKAVIQGKNPRQTKTALSQALGTSLSRSLTIARTEQLRSYREAGTSNYEANKDVVKTVTRIEELDDLTCIVCVDECGQTREVGTPFDAHPNCRGTDVPNVEGDDTKAPDGKEWFNDQSPDMQKEIMGEAKWEAWNSGEIEIGDLSKHTYDDRWGGMVQERSLSDAKEIANNRDSGD